MQDAFAPEVQKSIHYHLGIAMRMIVHMHEDNLAALPRTIQNVTHSSHYCIALYILIGQLMDVIDNADLDSCSIVREWQQRLSSVELLPNPDGPLPG
jgi:hypothetical protein